MPTYIYETIPQNEVEQPKRFEVRQSMSEKAFTHHPDTGVPVRRVIVGGTGVMGGMLAATFLAIFFVPMFFRIIVDRKLKEPRSTAQMQAEGREAHERATAEAANREGAR